jgi:hypothetical protein
MHTYILFFCVFIRDGAESDGHKSSLIGSLLRTFLLEPLNFGAFASHDSARSRASYYLSCMCIYNIYNIIYIYIFIYIYIYNMTQNIFHDSYVQGGSINNCTLLCQAAL